MRKTLSIIGFTAASAVIVLAGLIGWLSLRSPAMRRPSTERIEPTPARLARGRYVVEHVADCLGCHSDHESSAWGYPVKAGTEGQGGFPFDSTLGVPGMICAQNITPDRDFGLGNWTDGEIMRAFREGVGRDGQALFPMMPYYREMSDEDARSVVVYLRSIHPIHRPVLERRLDFPVNLLVKFDPEPLTNTVKMPDPWDRIAYGRYLAMNAGCYDCHTRLVRGRRDENMAYAGGWEMRGPWGRVVSANITPDPETFVGIATREEFIARFKVFEPQREQPVRVKAGMNTVMPWIALSGMTEQDLGAIYDYLRTVKPIHNPVVTFPAQ